MPTLITVRARATTPLRIVGSRSHGGSTLEAMLAALGPHELVAIGSSLKLCRVAEGAADLYPRLGLTSEWDTAAAQAVVVAAGGFVVTLAGTPLTYNSKPELLNPHFLVYADPTRDWLATLPAVGRCRQWSLNEMKRGSTRSAACRRRIVA